MLKTSKQLYRDPEIQELLKSTSNSTLSYEKAERLTRRLASINGVDVELKRSDRFRIFAGRCWWDGEDLLAIEYSKSITCLPERMAANVIIHEVAHAIDVFRRGTTDHSEVWSNIAKELGGTGDERLTDEENMLLKDMANGYVLCACGKIKLFERVHYQKYLCPSCGNMCAVVKKTKSKVKRA